MTKKEKLEKEAEDKYPLPFNPCKWVISKTNWFRERYVQEKLKKS